MIAPTVFYSIKYSPQLAAVVLRYLVVIFVFLAPFSIGWSSPSSSVNGRACQPLQQTSGSTVSRCSTPTTSRCSSIAQYYPQPSFFPSTTISLWMHTSQHDTITLDDNTPQSPTTLSSSSSTSAWARYGIFISSFSDGIENCQKASNYLRFALIQSLISHYIHDKEVALVQSTLFSPCSGPDLDLLTDIEEIDRTTTEYTGVVRNSATTTSNSTFDRERTVLQKLVQQSGSYAAVPLRIIYIPTAMYAIRADSTNTPGKQRQRARADGKQRRDQLVAHITRLLGSGKRDLVHVDCDARCVCVATTLALLVRGSTGVL